jgi:formate hydrogenlyase subunit 3/multisubunit Na+/H+ antiporter MnhD subunit
MNAPIIWIGLPAMTALVLWLFRKRIMLTAGIAAGVSLILVLFAWRIPIGFIINLGPFTMEISPSLLILGRQFILSDNDRGILMFLYSFGAFWLFGAGIAGATKNFIPIAMGLVSLSVAALAVEPFLYAALIVEIMVLGSIPILIIPGQMVGQGVLRYLLVQTLALPFILLAGWASARVDINPANDRLLVEAVILLGLGLAFWLAVFPFNTWLPILMEEGYIYSTGFLLSLLQCVALFLVLSYINSFAWLRDFPLLGEAFFVIGTLMVFTSGVWVIFQNDLRRIFGYNVILESGLSILALGLGAVAGPKILVSFLLSRTLSFGLWVLALTIFSQSGQPDFDNIRGKLNSKPITSLGLIVAMFSIAGLPLLGGFPVRQALLETMGMNHVRVLPWVFVGMVGFVFSGLRVVAALGRSDETSLPTKESFVVSGMIIVSITALLVIGVFPNWVLPILFKLLLAFENLG